MRYRHLKWATRGKYWIDNTRETELHSEKPKPKDMLKCMRVQAFVSEGWPLPYHHGFSSQTKQPAGYLTLFHNSVPLTVRHAVPRSPPPIFTLVSSHYFPMIHLEQSPYGNPLRFLSVSTAHCLYSYYHNYSIDYWNCLFAGIVLLKPGAMVPHPHTPSIAYSAWYFRNTENNVCLCFNKGCTYSSETKWITILTKEYYLGVS